VEEVGLSVIVALFEATGDHVYVDPPLAVKVTVPGAQSIVGVAATVRDVGVVRTATVVLEIHPVPLSPSTV